MTENLDPLDHDCPEDSEVVKTNPLLASLLGFFSWRSGRRPVPLPYDVYRSIIVSVVHALIYARNVRQYRHGCGKSKQKNVLVSVMLASKPFHELICEAWNTYWLPLGLPVPTRQILIVPKTSFRLSRCPTNLLHFTRLQFVSLDCGSAFEYTNNTWRPLIPVARLPPSLRELELLWSHASENEILDLVRRFCPSVTTLRLVFCTLFNRPRCTWWAGHQSDTDHAHYMKGHDLAEVEEYARTVAVSLRSLPYLENFHLGVYFATFQAVNTHRYSAGHVKYHSFRDSNRWIDHWHAQSVAQLEAVWNARNHNIPAPDFHLPCLADHKLWAVSCPSCVEQWSEPVERAERLAASVLALEHRSLRTVSFGSFVGEKRTRPSQWTTCRKPLTCTGENQVRVGTKRLDRGTSHSPFEDLLFRRANQRSQWAYVDHE